MRNFQIFLEINLQLKLTFDDDVVILKLCFRFTRNHGSDLRSTHPIDKVMTCAFALYSNATHIRIIYYALFTHSHELC